MTQDVHRTIEAVWRMEAAKIIGALARMTRDVGVAEEVAQTALVQALEQWPVSGVPDNAGAWLMQTAKRRALDRFRRGAMVERKHGELEHEMPTQHEPPERDLDDDVGDDVVRLVFTACHPVLSQESRVALTLRTVLGLTTEELARAFLVPVPTIQQRIVRAKKALADAGVPFELPSKEERAARLSSVLEVVYLVFNEGYAATAGDDWMRPALCQDALRLARVLQGLMPEESEVHGLAALLELQASRTRARTDARGEPVLLLQQNRAQWDPLLIRRGLAALARAEAIASEGVVEGAAGEDRRGPYTLQAAIAACHARARAASETDWARIAALYDVLVARVPSPVVELNRAVAVGMAYGAGEALAIVDELVAEGALATYHLLPSVRADLLVKLARFAEAQVEWERAASLTDNAREKALLLERAAACARGEPPPR